MRVAVPTSDCRTPSSHGPREGLFLIVDVDEHGHAAVKECRKVSAEHPHHDSEGANEDEVSHARWHLAVLNTLKDVDIVVASHMGPVMVRALTAMGKRVVTGVELRELGDVVHIAKEMGA